MIDSRPVVAWRVGEREAQEGRFTKGHRNLSVTNISTMLTVVVVSPVSLRVEQCPCKIHTKF